MKPLVICLVCTLFAVQRANAVTIFESGTLGSTGVTWSDIQNQTVPSANVATGIFNGARFHITTPVITTRVGGHQVAPSNAYTLFGAIVKLDSESDLPNSGNLSTPDVLGSTLLTFPSQSAEVFGNLNLSLDAGWYALVFGSGLFGASGFGAMPLNNPDLGSSSYIGFQSGAGWVNLTNPIFHNYRFVVEGAFVPEPAAIWLASGVIVFIVSARRRGRRI